jgi:large subunit ribosomal protein L35
LQAACRYNLALFNDPERSGGACPAARLAATRIRRKGCQMPKMKTKSGAKKRFRTTASGKVRFNSAYKRHMLINKPKKMKRQHRGTEILSDSDAKVVLKHYLPNG